ncbi:hypothetical protein JCM8202v2_002493 [Rhodotorula sphaerocarpa]
MARVIAGKTKVVAGATNTKKKTSSSASSSSHSSASKNMDGRAAYLEVCLPTFGERPGASSVG